jgi:hypothetical protein
MSEHEGNDEIASERGRRVIGLLERAGTAYGFEVRKEYRIPGGRIDVAWLWNSPVPGAEGELPIVAFEVESSWRTRKHIKGDLLNLQDTCPLVGVLVLLGEGRDVEGTRRFASEFANRPGCRIVVWSEEDVNALVAASANPDAADAPSGDAQNDAKPDPVSHASDTVATVPTTVGSRHSGKYQDLWRWLLRQQASPVVASFSQIEQILGFPLPASCRRHLPHWYGYDGTAVGRAIRDAGWRVRDVDLEGETVIFYRDTEVASDND